MQPHRDFPRNSQDRPFSIFNSTKNSLNLGSRPFVINNRVAHGPSPNIPSLNVQQINQFNNRVNSLNHLNQMQQPINVISRPPVLIRPKEKCQYCDESFEQEELLPHIEDCNMRKIPCDKCGERLLIDVFDVHFNECNMQNTVELGTLPSPMYIRRNQNMEEDNSIEDDDEMEEDDIFMDENAFSYESLLRLDETIVKKGMTPEQMKAFPVKLYIKSLDGEGSCNICLCDYETAEYTRELSCHHKFHEGCIDRWLEANITCPTCKKYLR